MGTRLGVPPTITTIAASTSCVQQTLFQALYILQIIITLFIFCIRKVRPRGVKLLIQGHPASLEQRARSAPGTLLANVLHGELLWNPGCIYHNCIVCALAETCLSIIPTEVCHMFNCKRYKNVHSNIFIISLSWKQL